MRPVIIVAVVAAFTLPGAAMAQGYRVQVGSLPSPPPHDTLPRDRVGRDVEYRDDDRTAWDKRLQHCLNDPDQSRHQRRACRDQGMPERRNKTR